MKYMCIRRSHTHAIHISGPKGKFLSADDLPLVHECVAQRFGGRVGMVVQDGGANILLVDGQKLTNLPGTVRQLTTTFETVNGHNVDIQTIFAPVDDYPRGQNAQSCRYLKLSGQTYA